MHQVARFFKVLAEEIRLKMLFLLFQRDEICVCDFMRILGISQSAASRHLRVLYNAGLIKARRTAQWMYYSLKSPVDEVQARYLTSLKETLQNCEESSSLLQELQKVKGNETCVSIEKSSILGGSDGKEG